MKVVAPDVSAGGDRVLDAILSGITGFVMALVTFRTRLALADQAKQRDQVDQRARFDRLEQRQTMTLRAVADIARAVGADKRFSDVLLQFLSEEEG